MLLDFFKPFRKWNKRFVPSDVVSQENTVRASVENARNRLEGLLSRGVPNLYFDDLFVYLQIVRAKFNSNCNLVLSLELVVHDSLH